MIEESNCSKRGCSHYQGVLQDHKILEGVPYYDETTERHICKAFPNGIPDDIAFGDNKHTQPVKGDNGIQFEKR